LGSQFSTPPSLRAEKKQKKTLLAPKLFEYAQSAGLIKRAKRVRLPEAEG